MWLFRQHVHVPLLATMNSLQLEQVQFVKLIQVNKICQGVFLIEQI